MDNDGRRLTYRKALARTWGVLVKTGFQLPIYSWIRMLQCYRIYDKLGTLSWEYDSEETVRDTKNWRCFAMTGAYLLLFFAQNPNRVLTEAQIYDRVWHTDKGFHSSIAKPINRLRQKIEPDQRNPVYIQSIRGVGYQFVPNIVTSCDI